MNFIDGLRELIYPPRCLGCGVLHQGICKSCSIELQLHRYKSYVGGVCVFSSIRYNTKASRILLSAKEDSVRAADDILLRALAFSLRTAMKTCGIRPMLIPIPHARGAVRKRGRDFVGEMAERLATNESLPVHQILRHNRKVTDQSSLSALSRFGNMSGAMSVENTCGRPCEVFLVDDLVTSGATMSEAVRTLEIAGFKVIAAVTALIALPLR